MGNILNTNTIIHFRKGNQKAFQQIFTQLYTSLCSFANKYLNDKDEAEDTVQEVFIELWNQRLKFENVNQVKAFLYLSIKNKCLNIIKHINIKQKYIDEYIDEREQEGFFEENVIKSEVISQIKNAINKLPEQRKKIILLNIQGLKNNEIAEDLSISVNTVKLQKKIAYKYLREQLGKILFTSFFF